MKRRQRSFGPLSGFPGLVFLALLVNPWSSSSQSGGFSLSLDLDESAGDQAVTSLDVAPSRTVSVQVFGVDLQHASSIVAYMKYDRTQVVYAGFEAGELLPSVHTAVDHDSVAVRIRIASLGGFATANSGLLFTVRFRAADSFTDTEIWLSRAELSRRGESETITPAIGVTLQAPALPSPDFDGNGVVGFSDFVAFAGGFGTRVGDATYECRYDLNADGGVGFDDFVILARRFGEAVNRAPVFAHTPPATRSVAENTSAGQAVGDPVTAVDADGDSVTYGLRGVHAGKFTIDSLGGQLLTKEGIFYDHETKDAYSVTVRVVDGKGGRATAVVDVAVTDVDEPPSAPPDSVSVTSHDSALAVTWLAAMDEAGKPPVSGYEVAHRRTDEESWSTGLLADDRTETGLTITGLTNEQPYEVRVRTLNDEGASGWSAPVPGRPTPPPPPPLSFSVCERTAQVRRAIVAEAGVNTCGAVTSVHLSGIASLDLFRKNISKLNVNDFSDLTALESLYLSSNAIRSLNARIFSNLENLEYLDLSFNDIRSLDKSIFANLSGLKSLRLTDNGLSRLPEDIFVNLRNLELLYLQWNAIRSLDANIFSNLSNLKAIRLSLNRLTRLPAGIFSNLTALEELDVSGNVGLALQTSHTANLPALKLLDFNSNKQRRVDANLLSKLPNLEVVYMGYNDISALPATLFSQSKALRDISLKKNRLNSLPAGIFAGLTSLTELDVSGNSTEPLGITVSLEKTAEGQLKATAHTGAPFEMILPLRIVNGSVSGGATGIVIPAGALESDALTVNRTAGTTAAVTVEITSLPELPTHFTGLTLVKSSHLPLQVIAPAQ